MSYLWYIFFIIDWILFIPVFLTVLYLLVFAVSSLFTHKQHVVKSKHFNRFIVLIPAYKADKTIMQTVNSILGQNYPQRVFDVVVISDHQDEMTNMRLAQLPITLLTPNFEVSSKAKSLQYAILNLPQFKIYDAVIILDADNIVEPEFLEQMNDAYESAGTKAIQAHRMSRNRDTATARLDAIFEEINNSIFRKGHIAVGLSAAICGSGMLFEFEWFKRNIMKSHNTVGEDKELEILLMREGIYVDYFEDIHVYDEKTRQTTDFNNQRNRWVYTQLHTLINNIRFLPKAILGRHYDLLDKLIQWMLVPRTIMMSIILIMSLMGVLGLVLPFINTSSAIKWWIICSIALFAFSVATPDYLVDKNWDTDFLRAPLVIIWGLLNIARVGKTEADTRIGAVGRNIKKIKSTAIIKSRK
ncbi:MAG: glycosyltransferase family 2 protein [Prevotella sp.]|nr:glycosyltransferase family 2 protein [Prevotella sp.]